VTIIQAAEAVSSAGAGLSAECGAVVVGTGAGGATTAAELAQAGIDVIMIEEGGYHTTESFTAESVRALRTLYRDGGGGLTLGRPSVLFAEGRCVGGSTVVNGGMSWRTQARVLARWSEEVDGVTERDMDPYFAEVESRLHVALQDPETIGRDSELLKSCRTGATSCTARAATTATTAALPAPSSPCC
jgi:choline dehydrogenase-like flavoprotein